jgi:hypothetical protein
VSSRLSSRLPKAVVVEHGLLMSVTFALSMDDGAFGACRLEIDGSVCDIDFSDTTDAIGDLVRAAIQIALGEAFVSLEFEREPGACMWDLAGFGPWLFLPDLLEVSVFDQPSRAARSKPKLIFREKCEKDDFCRALLAEVDRLTGAFDPKAYEEAFGQVVPRRAIEALRAALDASDPDPTPPDLERSAIISFTVADTEPFDLEAAMERHRRWFRTLGRGIGLQRSTPADV